MVLTLMFGVFLFSCGGEDKKEEASSEDGLRPLVAKTYKLIGERNYEKARTSAEELVLRDKEGKDAEAMYLMSLVYLRLGRESDAKAMAQKALEVDANYGGPYSILAEVNYLSNRFDKAVELARSALRLDPNLPLAYKVIGEIYLRKGDVAKSVQVLKAGVKLAPNDVELLNKMGSAYIKARDYQGAHAALKSAYEIDSQNPGVHFNLALVYSEFKDGTNALFHISQAEALYYEANNKQWAGKASSTKRIIARQFKMRPEDIGH
ncbi:MAG: tetratricopeptide repeat protein [Nitrospinaceae bacterium]